MATITLEEITNELLGNPPSSTNFDNTIEDDDPIDSSQYTQEDLDYWQEQEDKRNTIIWLKIRGVQLNCFFKSSL